MSSVTGSGNDSDCVAWVSGGFLAIDTYLVFTTCGSWLETLGKEVALRRALQLDSHIHVPSTYPRRR